MSATFDPYHRWLGIPPREQPPNHYRLLGLALDETDPEVIRDAAERQSGHVRRYQLGRHMELTQRLLNEIAAAKACLCDPARRAAYDAALRAELEPPEPPPVQLPISPPPVERAALRKWWPLGLLSVAAVLGGAALAVRPGRNTPAPVTEQPVSTPAALPASPPEVEPVATPEPVAVPAPTPAAESPPAATRPPVSEPVAAPQAPLHYALQFDGSSTIVQTPLRWRGKQLSLTLEIVAVVSMPPDGEGLKRPRAIVGDWEHAGGGIEFLPASSRCVFSLHNGKQYIPIEASIPTGVRLHLCGVYDGTNMQFFVNGQPTAPPLPLHGPHKCSSKNLSIGANPGDGQKGSHFCGQIEAVRVSKTVRYREKFTPERRLASDDDALLLYHFDEGTGRLLHDASGHSNDGYIKGEVRWVRVDADAPLGSPPSR